MESIIEAPWTNEQVANLNAWQRAGHVHEFTCPNHHDGSRVLIATVDGWRCPSCIYTQTWAHRMMMQGPPALPLNLIFLNRGSDQ